MHIAIDGRTIKMNPSGVGVWNIELIQNLLVLDSISQISLIIPENCSYEFAKNKLIASHLNHKLQLIPVAPPYRFVNFKRYFFEEFQLGRVINALKPDIYHATDSFGIPRLLSKTIKTILTIHDLIPLTPYKEYLSPFQSLLYKLSLNASLKRAHTIVTISQKTKDDISRYYPNLHTKISVYPDGILATGQQIAPKYDDEYSILQQYNVHKRGYLLYFGGFGPRKNSETVVEVFLQMIKQKIIDRDIKLILSGRILKAKKTNLTILTNIKKTIQEAGIDKNVVIIDYMTPDAKQALIKNALSVFFFSLYEGFGLPPCETILFGGVPLFSKTGIWFSYMHNSPLIIEDPHSIQEIIEKYQWVREHPEDLSGEILRLQDFLRPLTWKKMADNYASLYKKIINQ